MRARCEEKRLLRGSPSLLVLVLFVLIILSISLGVSVLIVYILIRVEILHDFASTRYTLISLIIFISLITGTGLAFFAGSRFLKPLRRLAEATKKVASGNFDIELMPSRVKEIDQLTLSFNEMAQELAGIEILRSDFVNNISHEFKTPIASIKGFAKRLQKDNLTDEQRKEYLDIIVSESERLTKLSNNILLLTRLESAERITERNEFFLDEQIRRTLLLLEQQFKKKQLTVIIDLAEVPIVGDEEILNNLWINLLENAIKYSPEGGTVDVTLKNINGYANVSISNEGAGMDDETKKHIFEKFYQGDHSRSTEGNGLGLSLVKRILELENGDITVTSSPNEGACFTVTLQDQSVHTGE